MAFFPSHEGRGEEKDLQGLPEPPGRILGASSKKLLVAPGITTRNKKLLVTRASLLVISIAIATSK